MVLTPAPSGQIVAAMGSILQAVAAAGHTVSFLGQKVGLSGQTVGVPVLSGHTVIGMTVRMLHVVGSVGHAVFT